jgi:hypothetical protein
MTEAIKTYIEKHLTGAYVYWPVVIYGGREDPPSAPYIVVRDYGNQGGLGTGYLIVVHEHAGKQKSCDYMLAKLSNMLNRTFIIDSYGNTQQLFANVKETGIIINEGDGTISKDRIFLTYNPNFL